MKCWSNSVGSKQLGFTACKKPLCYAETDELYACDSHMCLINRCMNGVFCESEMSSPIFDEFSSVYELLLTSKGRAYVSWAHVFAKQNESTENSSVTAPFQAISPGQSCPSHILSLSSERQYYVNNIRLQPAICCVIQ